MRTIAHRIDGEEVRGGSVRSGQVFDPATGEPQAEVPFADQGMVDDAVAAAVAAFEEWRDVPYGALTDVLFAYRQLLDLHRDDLVEAITSEHGKVRSDARGEVQRAIDVVEFACGIPQLMKGSYSESISSGLDGHTVHQPVGVCVGITPFNFPAMVPAWMFPVAIACRNTFVLKPSEKDPSAPLLLAELFDEAGLPPGVLNVVHGDVDTVEALIDHPDVAAVSSVGSTAAARAIYTRAAGAGERVQALGGAKNHLVVMPDADMDLAADAAVSAAFGSTGQRCMAISAVVTVADAAERLLPGIVERARAIRVGPASDPGSEMGPLVTAEARDRAASYLDRGVEEGAELVLDGRALDVPPDGYFLAPSVFDRVEPHMSVYTDEIFGPVLINVRVADLEAAIRLIDENPHGNGMAIFTASGRTAREFERRVSAGMVGVNVPIPVPMAYYPFGGWGDSLFGDTHVHGTEGVHFYTRTKFVATRWPEPPEGVDLSF